MLIIMMLSLLHIIHLSNALLNNILIIPSSSSSSHHKKFLLTQPLSSSLSTLSFLSSYDMEKKHNLKRSSSSSVACYCSLNLNDDDDDNNNLNDNHHSSLLDQNNSNSNLKLNSTQVYSLLSVEELQATCNHYVNNLPLGSLQKEDVMRIYYIMKATINKFHGVEAGKVAEELLKRVIDEINYGHQQYGNGTASSGSIKVSNRLYYRVLDAWAKSEDVGGVLRAEEILLTMERQYQEGNKDVEVTVFGFNCVIDGWARVARKFPCGKAGKRAEALLEWMLELDKLDGKSRQLKPDIITMNSLINAWSKSPAPDAAQRAQNILEYMETCNDDTLKPNDVSYTSVIVGWTNSDDPRAAFNAEVLLHKMEYLASHGHPLVKPNVVTYSAVINAFSKFGNARKAEELLSQIQKHYEEDLDPDMKPNVFTVSID